MTEDFKKRLRESIDEEMRDHEKYCAMAKEIRMECPHLAGVLKDIACEEETHHQLLKHMYVVIENP